jgi:hypothetical protein
MKRKVKAYLIVGLANEIAVDICQQYIIKQHKKELLATRDRWNRLDNCYKIVPCTITYTLPKRARKKCAI